MPVAREITIDLVKQLTEFEIIRQYFDKNTGVGNDCAIIEPREFDAGSTQCISTDTMVAGRHFLSSDDPFKIGIKLAATNLSDLAAAGASPRGAFLNLALPKAFATREWLAAFSHGLTSELSSRCPLLGGDTTSSPQLVLSMTVIGLVHAPYKPHTRSGAQIGDTIWVSGIDNGAVHRHIGDAAAGLACIDSNHVLHKKMISNPAVLYRHYSPTPRLALGSNLLGIATSCMDISDGIAGDLPHILRASQVSGVLDLDALPSSKGFNEACVNLSYEEKLELQLTGGDDYELLFTANKRDTTKVLKAARYAGLKVTPIGRIIRQRDMNMPYDTYLVFFRNGQPYPHKTGGYEHRFEA